MKLLRCLRDRLVFVLTLALLVGFGWGCASSRVTQDQEESVRSTLVVARAGNSVKLSWESKPDLIYTVVYSSSLGGNAKWQVLPGCEGLRGTGRTVTAEDRAPEGQARYYRLHIVTAPAQ